MKKILYIFALITSLFANSQTILPLPDTELCPNQEYTFTVSNLPGNFSSLNSIGSVTITQFPSGSGTSITFKAKFGDVNGEQGFEVSYQGGSKPFKYTKIKSLFGGYSENFSNPTTLSVPICQTTPVALNISGNKYWNTSTNPYTTFGNITTYKYKIPAGWFLNATLSTGSNYITATGPVTLTPTTNSGNGGLIEYIAKNDCSGAFFEGTPRYITINRPNPTFTLAPSSVSFTCGTPQTRTFTVNASSTLNCPVTYNWNLGANNGWLDNNGSPAPANFSTTTNSITLASANGNVLPSAVRVIPVLNGNNYPQMTCTTSWSPFISSASISGNIVICIGNSITYNLSNLGLNNSVAWSLSNNQFATITSSSQSNITLFGFANGLVDIIATITNQCGQVDVKKITLTIGTPVLRDISTSTAFCLGGYQREQNKLTVSHNQSTTQYQWHIGDTPGFPQLITGSSISIISGYNTNQVYLDVPVNVEDTNIYVRAKNSCGWSDWLYMGRPAVNCDATDPGCIQCYRAVPKKYTIYPNPSKDIVNIDLRDQNNKPEKNATISGELFDLMGQTRAKVKIIDNKATFSVQGLNKGIYVLKIYINDQVESHQIAVE